MMGHEHGMHCSCWSWLGGLLWIAAAVTLVFAWVATAKGTVFGLEANQWYADAFVLGILAIPLKLKRGCGGGCGSGCGTCK